MNTNIVKLMILKMVHFNNTALWNDKNYTVSEQLMAVILWNVFSYNDNCFWVHNYELFHLKLNL